jgi:phage baseplate assembly protein W
MPLERVSKGFKDISMSFQSNPLNYDLIALNNANAIARSVRNLVFTYPGERFFDENLGSKISQSLFENIDEIEAAVIKDEIKNTIENYEPRVIEYTIVGIDVPPQQLSFALQPTR